MPLKLMYITNNPQIAKIADDCGTNIIFIDLETIGKAERQPGDTVKSHHSLDDIRIVKSVLKKAKLLVRVNPIWENSRLEINAAIENGADILMLPYFKTAAEVKTFINIVAKRVKVMLLCETKEAVENIDEILTINGIDRIHIGLNDLHMCYNMRFMFELLTDGTVEGLCKKFRKKNIPYGFGGIARLNEGLIPAEIIIAEHYRLGSDAAILSRSFCNWEKIENLEKIENIFKIGLKEIRDYELSLQQIDTEKLKLIHLDLINKIDEIVNCGEKV